MAERIPLLTDEEWQRAPFGQWVAHPGTRMSSRRLAMWLAQGGQLWLNSDEPQCGKSHLLYQLLGDAAQCAIVRPQRMPECTAAECVAECLRALHNATHWLIDLDVGVCDSIIGETLFHLVERAKQQEKHLLISWCCEDALLSPPELASRLRTFDKTTLHPPGDDDALKAVLQSVAHNLHWDVPEAVIKVMLTHTERTLAHQLDVLQTLEQESRPERIRPTQRWVRERLRDKG